MAAVLQVVAAQVLERAGDAALERHSGRIAPREIREAVRRDGELAQLVGDEALAEGGLLGRLVTTRNDELAGERAQKVEALLAEVEKDLITCGGLSKIFAAVKRSFAKFRAGPTGGVAPAGSGLGLSTMPARPRCRGGRRRPSRPAPG